jgi:hypothetical protein
MSTRPVIQSGIVRLRAVSRHEPPRRMATADTVPSWPRPLYLLCCGVSTSLAVYVVPSRALKSVLLVLIRVYNVVKYVETYFSMSNEASLSK